MFLRWNSARRIRLLLRQPLTRATRGSKKFLLASESRNKIICAVKSFLEMALALYVTLCRLLRGFCFFAQILHRMAIPRLCRRLINFQAWPCRVQKHLEAWLNHIPSSCNTSTVRTLPDDARFIPKLCHILTKRSIPCIRRLFKTKLFLFHFVRFASF